MRTIVSWTRFCEWVQGKKVEAEKDLRFSTQVFFDDGSEAIVYSQHTQRFGEHESTPPIVEIVIETEPCVVCGHAKQDHKPWSVPEDPDFGPHDTCDGGKARADGLRACTCTQYCPREPSKEKKAP
jgi:hypothetical protein